MTFEIFGKSGRTDKNTLFRCSQVGKVNQLWFASCPTYTDKNRDQMIKPAVPRKRHCLFQPGASPAVVVWTRDYFSSAFGVESGSSPGSSPTLPSGSLTREPGGGAAPGGSRGRGRRPGSARGLPRARARPPSRPPTLAPASAPTLARPPALPGSLAMR